LAYHKCRTDSEIDLATAHPEYSAWQWIPIERLPELAVSFKKPLYVDVPQEFGQALGAGRPEVSARKRESPATSGRARPGNDAER
jgi:hypothetical protein